MRARVFFLHGRVLGWGGVLTIGGGGGGCGGGEGCGDGGVGLGF